VTGAFGSSGKQRGHRMRISRLATAVIAVGALAPMSALAIPTASAATRNIALGVFHPEAKFLTLHGYSYFTESAAGIRVQGKYSGLQNHQPYFTVIYGDNNCDPVSAFPIGPFYSNTAGQAHVDKTFPNPKGIQVSTTGSVSVRHSTPQGKVIAVPGKPSIGLVECDSHPYVR
jgi:hypothetical protein